LFLETIRGYEAGTISIPTNDLNRLADLFCMNLYDFYAADQEKQTVHRAFAFRADQMNTADLLSIAQFKKMVVNYRNMQKAVAHKQSGS